MKTTVLFFKCICYEIKKKFFNSKKSDKYHGCEEVLNFDKNSSTSEEEKSFNEYLESYKITTRWQTL